MATLQELHSLRRDGDLLNKIEAACAIVAEEIRVAATPPVNQTQREVWAKEAFVNPAAKALEMIWPILAANESATVAQIQSASDDAILSNVRAAVDIFAGGL